MCGGGANEAEHLRLWLMWLEPKLVDHGQADLTHGDREALLVFKSNMGRAPTMSTWGGEGGGVAEVHLADLGLRGAGRHLRPSKSSDGAGERKPLSCVLDETYPVRF